MSTITTTRKGEAQEAFAHLITIETDDCVLWPYSVDGPGYGKVKIAGKIKQVHRLACIEHHGPAPAGCEAAHSCGVRRCMNYRHLRWATRAENMADKLIHGTVSRGECHGMSKLLAEQVVEIRRRVQAGESQRALADEYGVTQPTVRKIVNRRTWGWLS